MVTLAHCFGRILRVSDSSLRVEHCGVGAHYNARGAGWAPSRSSGPLPVPLRARRTGCADPDCLLPCISRGGAAVPSFDCLDGDHTGGLDRVVFGRCRIRAIPDRCVHGDEVLLGKRARSICTTHVVVQRPLVPEAAIFVQLEEAPYAQLINKVKNREPGQITISPAPIDSPASIAPGPAFPERQLPLG